MIDRVKIPGDNSTHISLRDDTIKCTDWTTNAIYCYTLTGQQIWTFKDENVLREPRGIALDKNSNVYVADRSTNNVVVLSPDGNNYREILTKSDGLDRPFSLRINIDRNELLVCNKNGSGLELRPLNTKASFSGRSKKIHKSTFSRDNRDVKWCKLVAQLIFL